jgi:hypothetical protein
MTTAAGALARIMTATLVDVIDKKIAAGIAVQTAAKIDMIHIQAIAATTTIGVHVMRCKSVFGTVV